MSMSIASEHRGEPAIALVTLAGELDASNFEALIGTIQSCYAGGAIGCVIDLGGLTFMASSGLVALYAAERIFRGEAAPDLEAGWQVFHDMGGESGHVTNVRLVDTQDAVQRVLDRTGMSRLFATDPSVDAAMAAIRGG
ncbi:MAG TPA: STAS domain-containing protein [Candidatus Limnocylindrales bacterium]|nr:STAS domain-containing protein [Candidatus Limnocylindrales bacterium]